MEALKILGSEHELIRRYLNVLALAVQRLESGQRPPMEFFEHAVDFSRRFVDRFHHIKEEHLMFARLAQVRHGEIDSLIDTLRFQHERGRNHVSGISSALPGYARGEDTHATMLVEDVAAYIALLRRHIQWEDHVFYPLVERHLPDADKTGLLREFERENQKSGPDFFTASRETVASMESLLATLAGTPASPAQAV